MVGSHFLSFFLTLSFCHFSFAGTVVSIDTLPLPLNYVKKGEVKALVGQDYFGWGYESVRMLLDYAKDGKKPATTAVRAKVDIVTKENADAFGKIWQEKWLKE